MKTKETRSRIIDAATRVVNRVGFHRATVDAIAEEAEVSKGGVLHYFRSKDQCFEAILERVFSRILSDAEKLCQSMPEGPGRMLKAYVTAWIKWQEPPRNVQILGLLENDVLRERLIDFRVKHYALVLDDAISPVVVQKVLLICAGLWTTPLLARANKKELSAFFELMKAEMLQMIDDAAKQ